MLENRPLTGIGFSCRKARMHSGLPGLREPPAGIFGSRGRPAAGRTDPPHRSFPRNGLDIRGTNIIFFQISKAAFSGPPQMNPGDIAVRFSMPRTCSVAAAGKGLRAALVHRPFLLKRRTPVYDRC
jgi:hypothetical protein